MFAVCWIKFQFSSLLNNKSHGIVWYKFQLEHNANQIMNDISTHIWACASYPMAGFSSRVVVLLQSWTIDGFILAFIQRNFHQESYEHFGANQSRLITLAMILFFPHRHFCKSLDFLWMPDVLWQPKDDWNYWNMRNSHYNRLTHVSKLTMLDQVRSFPICSLCTW